MRRLLVLAMITSVGFVHAAPAVAQDRGRFSVGTVAAKRGQKVTGTIEVPAAVDAALSIPVAVVHGARPGPVLAVVAGSHGTEYASIIAVEELITSREQAATIVVKEGHGCSGP